MAKIGWDKFIISTIGKKEYVKLLKKYNLCTKKWSYGRTKGFYKKLLKVVKDKINEEKTRLKEAENSV